MDINVLKEMLDDLKKIKTPVKNDLLGFVSDDIRSDDTMEEFSKFRHDLEEFMNKYIPILEKEKETP